MFSHTNHFYYFIFYNMHHCSKGNAPQNECTEVKSCFLTSTGAVKPATFKPSFQIFGPSGGAKQFGGFGKSFDTSSSSSKFQLKPSVLGSSSSSNPFLKGRYCLFIVLLTTMVLFVLLPIL